MQHLGPLLSEDGGEDEEEEEDDEDEQRIVEAVSPHAKGRSTTKMSL